MFRFLCYLAILLAVVPLWGLAVTGTLRGAWRFSRDWAVVMGWTIVAGCVVFLMLPS